MAAPPTPHASSPSRRAPSISAASAGPSSSVTPSRGARDDATELYDQSARTLDLQRRRDQSTSRHESIVHPPTPKQSATSPSKHATSSASHLAAARRKHNMNSSDKAEKRRSSRACLECRLAKTKCHVTDNQDVCDRCAKFSFDCRFVRHHRGRKPVSKLAAIDPDDLDAAPGASRAGAHGGGFDGSDDDLATDHDTDSGNEDYPPKNDQAPSSHDDTDGPHASQAGRTSAREHDAGGATPADSTQRRSRDAASTRASSGRSHSRARMQRNANNLHELDTSARRRIWEMLAQKIPQRGSTYTFVSKGEVAHDNLQASSASSKPATAGGSAKRGSSPASSSALERNSATSADAANSTREEGATRPTASGSASAQPKQASAPSQHFASTFRNLLRPVDKRAVASSAQEEAASAVAARYPRLPETLNLFGPKDPVDLGILSMAAARRLYAYYFKHLNPWGMNFDPRLVSHDAVRASSSYLYSTILYLASRYIELADGDETHGDSPAYYPPAFARPRPDDDRITSAISAQLGSHVRSLAIMAFAAGDRRMETGVAMYLSSVWKEADDHFTILYCSYAAKIMSDIPTELLSLLPSSDAASAASAGARAKNGVKHKDDVEMAAAQQQQRLRRNQQRQFLFHFIQEHTHLLHFAPRPNFDRGPSLLRNLLAWADDALATEDDILLCADIDSVLLQTKYKSIMERAQAQEKDTLYGGSECFLLLQSFTDELEGWRSRWELQARKINERFGRASDSQSQRAEAEADALSSEQREDEGKEDEAEDLVGHLPLEARMHLLSVMRSSLVMQVSSIAFRASLRDINKAKPVAAGAAAGKASSASAFSPSALSAMDDRAEQVYYTCLDSALNLLVHTMQMPASILRHAQDMIMVLAPHAALLATYLISLPLPSVPPQYAASASASERMAYEYARVKTRVRRRKEYERKCLELMRDTRESFRLAQVRADDHVGLCAQYFDSLLNVIEGEPVDSAHRQGRSLLSNTSVLAGTKRSRSSLDAHRGEPSEEASTAPRGLVQTASVDAAVGRASSAGPAPGSRPSAHIGAHSSLRHPAQSHAAATSNMDTSAAETLLNLHSETHPPGTEDEAAAAGAGESSSRMLAAGYYGSGTHLAHPRVGAQHTASTPPSSTSAPASSFSPGSFVSSGMFGHFVPPASSSIPNSPQHAYPHHPHAHHPAYNPVAVPHAHAPDFPFAPGMVAPPGTVTPTGAAGTGTSTPVDWTWLQSFLEVPEFSWM